VHQPRRLAPDVAVLRVRVPCAYTSHQTHVSHMHCQIHRACLKKKVT
jgi:hypothetical protein